MPTVPFAMLRPPKRSPVSNKAHRSFISSSAKNSSQKKKYHFQQQKKQQPWHVRLIQLLPFVSKFTHSKPATQSTKNRSELFNNPAAHPSLSEKNRAEQNTKVFAPKPVQDTPQNSEENKEDTPQREHNHQVSDSVKKLFYSLRKTTQTALEESSKAGSVWQKISLFAQSVFFSVVQFFRYWSLKFTFLKKANVVISSILIGATLLAAMYISFFDSYFLVKNYRIEFAADSYLSETDTQKLVKAFGHNSLLGFLPGNQFWYLNNQHLTSTAQSLFPEVEHVVIKQRQWPNTAVLELKMQPILLTLRINQDQYWRISNRGTVLTRDDLRLKERLVLVRNEIVINNKNPDIFQQYSFAGDLIQREKFWFINWLWQKMDSFAISHAETEIISLYDTEVIINTAAGTELRFDSRTFSPQAQETRLQSILGDTTIAEQERDGQLAYIDFRVPGKVFICRVGAQCDS